MAFNNQETETPLLSPTFPAHQMSRGEVEARVESEILGALPLQCWLPEGAQPYAHCSAAVACLVALVSVLIAYDGQPQESWPSGILTLNGLVALLATLCRTFFMVTIAATLTQGKWNQLSLRHDSEDTCYRLQDFALFDEAAKGPLGSIQLLWRFKGRHIECLGAALSILSLAFGVFSQQLIALEINAVERSSLGDTGQVPRATWVESVRGYSNSWTPLSTTKLAIYDGFMAAAIDQPQVRCPTGNCTWPITPTVGVCGACINTTERIQIPGPVPPPGSLLSGPCSVSTPGGIQINSSCDLDFGIVFTLGPGSGEVFSSHKAPLARGAPNVIAEFGALGLPVRQSLNATIRESLATECALWYCLQAHNVSVRQGVLEDEVVETWSRVNATGNAGGEAMVGGRRVVFIDIPASFNIEPGEVYGLGPMQMITIQQYFNKTVVGNVTADGYTRGIWSTTDYAEGLHNSFDDVDSWLDRLTRSMTNEVRLSGWNASSTAARYYRGTVLSSQVMFIVRWLWLIYPAGLVALSVLCLIIAATQTLGMTDVRAWKDDPLVPLCLDLDVQLRERARAGLLEPNGTRKLVGRHHVLVTRGDDGFPMGFAMKQD
ncbi:hypothetical protein C8A05DRAFT_45743 [Staphylotrichum tortipilum]|uniref:Uncharacterized protein n=1 Tax=Staphylotrichum tortipilum TaxID=2831512 RepID=A0AAN6MGH1_9PEZI|nr:hypothetical protein C8A05DRAFT_45743 [Staphylotrichum longicolle]